MAPADKAVLRLATGLGLAVLVSYGLGMTAPFVVCLLTILILCKPGPPIPFVKGMVLALVVLALLAAGVLMVPILEHYAVTGVLLTTALLYMTYFIGARRASPMTVILVIAIAAIPVVGVVDQGFAGKLGSAMATGLAVGIVVNGVSHALFPDDAPPTTRGTAPVAPSPQAAHRAALQATLVIMPVFVIALSNPTHFFPAIVKSGALGQQARSTSARSAGSELVGSTIMGALMAAAVWLGLSLAPTLWMLMLWMMAAAFWAGRRLFRVRPTRWAPTFWSNALVTMLILLGPAIEDSVVGKDVFKASVTRTALFIGAALYAWAIVWTFERWFPPRPDTAVPRAAAGEPGNDGEARAPSPA
jgi:hypothetical protein